MQMILNSEDLKKIIEDNYEGVTNIKIGKNVKIIVDINTDVIKKVKVVSKIDDKSKVKPQSSTETIVTGEVSLEERNDRAAQIGAMMAGGSERTLVRF